MNRKRSVILLAVFAIVIVLVFSGFTRAPKAKASPIPTVRNTELLIAKMHAELAKANQTAQLYYSTSTTTTVATKPAAHKAPKKLPNTSKPVPVVASGDRATILPCIRQHEHQGRENSDADYEAVSPSGKYRGAYQADASFYASYAAHPLNDQGQWLYATADVAPASIQDDMAWNGYEARKLGPWPPSQGHC